MRSATLLAIIALVALPLGGCGGSEDGTTGTASAHDPASVTRVVRTEWEQTPDCEHPAGTSRWGCSIGTYRCQAVVVDRGWSVSCSRSGESIAFLVHP